MAKEDLGKALRAIDDEKLRQKVAEGDLSGLSDVDLNDEEKGLLIGAAAEYPDTEDQPSEAAFKSRAMPAAGKLSAYQLATRYAFDELPRNPRLGQHDM